MGDSWGNTVELVQRAKAGDREALSSLLGQVQGPLLHRIRLMMGPSARRVAESSDFLNGVMIEAITGLDNGAPRDETRFLRWLVTIARHNIQDGMRRQREHALESMSISLSGDRGPDARGPAAEAEIADDVHQLVEALERLEEDHRRVIELRSLDGLRFADVGERMGRSEDAVRMLFRRAMIAVGHELGLDAR